mgnify:FL=1
MKAGFKYVRDRTFPFYDSQIYPEITNGFVDLPRFGHDESVFLINRGTKDKPNYESFWDEENVTNYLVNLFNYKYKVENSYLVINLHPCHIGVIPEISNSFIRFLDYLDSFSDVEFITAEQFCENLAAGRIDISPKKQFKAVAQDSYLEELPLRSPNSFELMNRNNFPVNPTNSLDIGFFRSTLLKYTNFLTVVDENDNLLDYYVIGNNLFLNTVCNPFSTKKVKIRKHKSQN